MTAALFAMLAWFPLQPGATWIYEQEIRDHGPFRYRHDRGDRSPDFCFPLAIGKHWRAVATNEYAWTVVGLGCGNAGFCPDSVAPSDYHLAVTEASSGGTDHVWFRKGVGITGEWWWHNGTYTEIRVRLVKFRQP